MCLLFGFVIFWQKDFSAKAAPEMLVKLTPGHRLGPGYVLQLLFCKNRKIVNNSTTTEATS